MTHQSFSLEQVDPEIAEKIYASVAALPHNRWRLMSPFLPWAGAAGVLAGVTSVLITYEDFLDLFNPAWQPNPLIGAIVGFLVFALIFAAGARWSRAAQSPVWSSLAAADLRAVSRGAILSRAETAYIDALASLADASPLLGETLTRDLLAQLNDLAANARALETHRGQLSAALGPTPLADLEQERAALVGRLEAAPDAASRRAIDQSIALCDGRLAQVRALAPGLARIEAQQEVVYQTLASVESSLRRVSSVPAEPPTLQVEEIRRATTEAVCQTRAVEEAVQEVLSVAAR